MAAAQRLAAAGNGGVDWPHLRFHLSRTKTTSMRHFRERCEPVVDDPEKVVEVSIAFGPGFGL
jgi:hypothetical protein